MRAADLVMSPRRAQAAYPNALSFARTGMASLVAGRWRVEKLRVELDPRGRGEVLYRLVGQGWTFHFFLVSIELAEDVKLDRNFAQSWDAMGVLCQGEWTPDRERLLRQEVPKQRAGRADYDTLMYARGNRSGRLFAHVVDSLAEGRQPDLSLISKVGYVLRTTAFIGNGQLGTRPLAGYEPDHPFRAPYHAQIVSAFLLREYVFDLVEVMARARNPRSARLCRSYRRYIGLGNSAATGLLAYVVNHPRLIDRWQSTWEQAIAAAWSRTIVAGSPEASQLLDFLRKAEAYLRESVGAPDEVFADAALVADDLSTLRQRLAPGLAQRGATSRLDQLAREATGWKAASETLEVLNAIALELSPEIVRAHAHHFWADETVELHPDQPAEDLLVFVRRRYAWALGSSGASDRSRLWYRARNAPRDVRRARRGLAPDIERETPLDVSRMVHELEAALAALPPNTPVLALLVSRPDLRWVIARIQSTLKAPYAELREDFLSASLSPFPAIRLILAFYGMEKFETAAPKSVRGALLQGAPIAEDVAAGREGTWPFPEQPKLSTYDSAAEMPASLLADPVPIKASLDVVPAIERQVVRVAPVEIVRASTGALQGCGVELGVAEEAARLVELAEGLHGDGITSLLRDIEAGAVAASLTIEAAGLGPGSRVLRASHRSPIVSAPLALDLACYEATHAPSGRGAVLVRCGSGASILRGLTLRAAERGFASFLVWSDAVTPTAGHANPAGFALAFSEGATPVYAGVAFDDIARLVQSRVPDAASAFHRLGAEIDRTLDAIWRPAESRPAIVSGLVGMFTLAEGRRPRPLVSEYVLACARDRGALGSFEASFHASLRQLAGALAASPLRSSLRRLEDERRVWQATGIPIPITRLSALEAASSRSFVSPDEEAKLHPGGFDPLTNF